MSAKKRWPKLSAENRQPKIVGQKLSAENRRPKIVGQKLSAENHRQRNKNINFKHSKNILNMAVKFQHKCWPIFQDFEDLKNSLIKLHQVCSSLIKLHHVFSSLIKLHHVFSSLIKLQQVINFLIKFHLNHKNLIISAPGLARMVLSVFLECIWAF